MLGISLGRSTICGARKRDIEVAITPERVLWIKEQFDINYPNQPISDYSYLAKAKDVQEVCRVISAFGTGITDFKMVDVPIEKVLGELPQKLQKRIISDIEQKQAEIRGNEKISEIALVMRSNTNFFIITLSEEDEMLEYYEADNFYE